mgnify:CR=1 FL=1
MTTVAEERSAGTLQASLIDDTQSGTDIPVLDVGDYLTGVSGAREKLAPVLYQALTEVGFFYLIGHGVPRSVLDDVCQEGERFHALPLEQKNTIKLNDVFVGYMGDRQQLGRTSEYYEGHTKPDRVEAFFMQRDRAPFKLPFPNQWPQGLPGFRETLVNFFETMEELSLSLLPLFATALDLPPDFFEPLFLKYQNIAFQRLSHYPPDPLEEDQYNSSPHTDGTFFTLLATTDVPGLEIKPKDQDWIRAPAWPEAFLVNSGDVLTRWSNGKVLSTPHRVRNLSGRDRYSIPYFVLPSPDTVIECLPTCHEPDNPPREEPITVQEYLRWYLEQNFTQYGKFEHD